MKFCSRARSRPRRSASMGIVAARPVQSVARRDAGLARDARAGARARRALGDLRRAARCGAGFRRRGRLSHCGKTGARVDRRAPAGCEAASPGRRRSCRRAAPTDVGAADRLAAARASSDGGTGIRPRPPAVGLRAARRRSRPRSAARIGDDVGFVRSARAPRARGEWRRSDCRARAASGDCAARRTAAARASGRAASELARLPLTPGRRSAPAAES